MLSQSHRSRSVITSLLSLCLYQCVGASESDELELETTRSAASRSQPTGAIGTQVVQVDYAGNKRQELLTYEVKNGYRFFQGDIRLGPDPSATAGQAAIESATTVDLGRRWPNGVVYYDFDISASTGFSAAQQATIENALRNWESVSTLRFVRRTTQNDYVQFFRGSGCWSHVGRVGGVQQLSLQDDATGTCLSQDTIMHEVGHSVGLWHEQSRQDRDRFVIVDLCYAEAGKEHNFNKEVSNAVGDYDINSLMHYSSWTFRAGLRTDKPECAGKPAFGYPLTRLDGTPITPSTTPTAGDIRGIASLYGTSRTVSLGEYHSCATLGEATLGEGGASSTTSDVKCWGDNSYGQLGLGDTQSRGDQRGEMGAALPMPDLGAGVRAQSISAGGSFTCAVLAGSGAVKCWGGNQNGQLGQGDTVARGDGPGEMGDNLPAVGLKAPAVAVSAGYRHACALLQNGAVQCWGYNANGQLGVGDSNDRGDNPGEMAQLGSVDLGAGRYAIKVVAGTFHTCALLDDRTVKCWGYNGYGELGLGDTMNRGNRPSQMGDKLAPVALGTGNTATDIAVGVYHTCAALTNGTVKCWGFNAAGGLGLGDTNHRGDGPNEMGDNLPAVSLGTGLRATNVYAFVYGTCARLGDARFKCWGYNADGELGLGDRTYRGDGPNEMGDTLPFPALGSAASDSLVATMAAGKLHVCAVNLDNVVKCWGFNYSGQLGAGDINTRGDNPNEMGQYLPAASL